MPPRHVKVLDEFPEHVYSTAGWDSWSKLQEGDAEAQLCVQAAHDGGGLLYAHDCFGDAAAPQLRLAEWSSVSASVDLNQGEMRAFTRKCRLFFLVHVLGL